MYMYMYSIICTIKLSKHINYLTIIIPRALIASELF